eukprot:SAG31_NODE_44030_length_264_cov_1.139394_1_plen_37_part_10
MAGWGGRAAPELQLLRDPSDGQLAQPAEVDHAAWWVE